MSIGEVGPFLMVSNTTGHQAKAVGDGGWVVSFLPGRTLSAEQAFAALEAAEESVVIRDHARNLGLTALELVGLAALECAWPPPKTRSRWRWSRRGGAHQSPPR